MLSFTFSDKFLTNHMKGIGDWIAMKKSKFIGGVPVVSFISVGVHSKGNVIRLCTAITISNGVTSDISIPSNYLDSFAYNQVKENIDSTLNWRETCFSWTSLWQDLAQLRIWSPGSQLRKFGRFCNNVWYMPFCIITIYLKIHSKKTYCHKISGKTMRNVLFLFVFGYHC